MYFKGLRVGDEIYNTINGKVYVTDIFDDFFVSDDGLFFDYDGYLVKVKVLGNDPEKVSKNQVAFWGEIKFVIPQKPKIELKESNYLIDIELNTIRKLNFITYDSIQNGLSRNDKKIAENALKQIKEFTRLLALRDELCPNSKGYEFRELHARTNYYIVKNLDHNYWVIGNANTYNYYMPGLVYFKTKEDAILICNILNNDRFDI